MIKKWKDSKGQLHSGKILEKKNEFEIIECSLCGFIHVIPIPSKEDIEKVYQSTYYQDVKPAYIEKSLDEQDWINLHNDWKYSTIEQLIPPNKRTILDIGSGPGLFLKMGAERGWNTLGIEPSEQAYNYSKNTLGLNIINDFFNDRLIPQLNDFDVVHLSDVLEHVIDPNHIINLVNSILKPDGLICIVVPNDFNPLQIGYQKIRGCNPWWVAPPHHINYFNFQSLEKLLEKNNFEVILKESTFPMEFFLLFGEDYIGKDQIGKACHRKRMNFERNLEQSGLNRIRQQLYHCFAQLGIGRQIVIFARLKQ